MPATSESDPLPMIDFSSAAGAAHLRRSCFFASVPADEPIVLPRPARPADDTLFLRRDSAARSCLLGEN